MFLVFPVIAIALEDRLYGYAISASSLLLTLPLAARHSVNAHITP